MEGKTATLVITDIKGPKITDGIVAGWNRV